MVWQVKSIKKKIKYQVIFDFWHAFRFQLEVSYNMLHMKLSFLTLFKIFIYEHCM
jgi:hypothetical protein